MDSSSGDGKQRTRLRHVILVLLIWMFLYKNVRSCSSTDCNAVLREAEGGFTSPCYPQNYPNLLTCTWKMQAPPGYIIQLSFLDFELEEASGCMYDQVVVNMGNADAKFCGLTANGLTLNSTGNFMELSFKSDFSVRKRGFSVSFRHVAVALRNQKVTVNNGNGQVAMVSSSVAIPTLLELTVCFEVERIANKQREWLFSYYGSGNSVKLSFGSDQSGTKVVVDGELCPVGSIISTADFTSSMRPLCLTWTSSKGQLAVYFNGVFSNVNCSASINHFVPAGGIFQLGGQQSFDGNIYNLRLWNHTMTVEELRSLTCDQEGNVIDWDNSHWTVPSSLVQIDNTLSCICYPHCTHLTSAAPASGVNTPFSSGCTTMGCPVPILISPTTTTPSSSMPLIPSISTVSSIPPSSSSSSAQETSSIQPAVSSAPTNPPATNPSVLEDLFYRVSFWTTSELSQQAVERAVSLLLNQAFHKWTHSVEHFSVVKTGAGSNRFSCQALLLISNESLSADDVSAQLTGRRLLEDSQLQLFSVSVRLIENCQEDVFLNYYWPETRPRTTQLLPCFPDKNQSATRTCLINLNDYSPYWASADFTNCTVTAENAADVAEKLANFTRNGLSDDEISHVVTKVQQLVNVAKIDAAVAESVVSIISNVMTSSEAVLGNASNIALRTVDELAQKLEFDGLSVNITSKHLALGILAFNATTFNGSSFSAFIPPNSADPKIEFEQTANPLAQVTLPGSLLSGVSLSDADRSSLSRINFVFFSNTNLFKKEQDSLSLNSYVVASSVGNLSIRDLKDPVRIQIAHLTEQTSSHRFCMFWDFTLNNGDGGWNERGCSVSKESTRNKTICLCNHLTHFGVLMDVSQTSSQIDPKNKKILTFLSYIGCGVSAICAAATLLTYIAFEKLRRDYPSKILMNLSTSLLCLNMVFLLDGWLASMVDSAGLCTSAAVLLHYFLLTSFTWMGLESIHMYIALVKVFNTYIRRYILKFCAVGWGLPAVIVGIVVTVDKSHYGILEDSKDESAKMCWIKNQSVFYTTCVGYFCLVFLLNVAMFIVVMMQICGRNGKRSNRSLREEVLRNLRSVVSLTFLLGMTWGFALFAWGPVYLAFTYLFTIFNSLQGVFIFIFHCALKENVQKQWRRYLCCGPYRQSDNSDLSKTPTNNTKKVSSDNLAKSLSSSSFGSSTSNWTSKAKATLTPFSKRYRNAGPWRVIERRSYILRCLATARRSYGHFKGHHENGTYHCREVFIRIIEVSHTYDVWVMLLYGVLTPHSSRL
ncbi:adhesion G-protein coupled receptor G6 isoform X5 [Oryzias latipes]|uniref:adhesion G-protein coupled receptor G6 isoform X5 n=1 Tax=Oryzias latipes TaxID=8090 RepID=UPI000CE1F70C|nr:adhesion G-protein coupled receptor G6 isoform X5 [Oryzias latipes]